MKNDELYIFNSVIFTSSSEGQKQLSAASEEDVKKRGFLMKSSSLFITFHHLFHHLAQHQYIQNQNGTLPVMK
jgi:hypothetical protein